MQRTIITVIGVLAVVLIIGLFITRAPADSQTELGKAKNVVEQFGQQLKLVPLSAEPGVTKSAMDKYYKTYVAPSLLVQWEKDPTKAPGRLASGPLPDRLEVYEIKRDGNAYAVRGNIIETSSSGPAVSFGITARLGYQGGKWMIDSFSGGPAR